MTLENIVAISSLALVGVFLSIALLFMKKKKSVKNIENGSAVIIDKIILGDIHLVHLDFFGIYRTNAGTKKTYGYMDEEGIYKFKIRYNALSLNYLSNILAKIT